MQRINLVSLLTQHVVFFTIKNVGKWSDNSNNTTQLIVRVLPMLVYI